jgi:hypothetical protein
MYAIFLGSAAMIENSNIQTTVYAYLSLRSTINKSTSVLDWKKLISQIQSAKYFCPRRPKLHDSC